MSRLHLANLRSWTNQRLAGGPTKIHALGVEDAVAAREIADVVPSASKIRALRSLKTPWIGTPKSIRIASQRRAANRLEATLVVTAHETTADLDVKVGVNPAESRVVMSRVVMSPGAKRPDVMNHGVMKLAEKCLHAKKRGVMTNPQARQRSKADAVVAAANANKWGRLTSNHVVAETHCHESVRQALPMTTT